VKWWPRRRAADCSGEAEVAKCEAQRALKDAHNFGRRADAIQTQADQIRRRNHIAEAMEWAIRPRSAEQ
jgi:hypothetical protein